MKILLTLLFFLSYVIIEVQSGPVLVGACYTACNAGYVACMSASGLVAGTTGPVGWWAWLTGAAAACSFTQGACMSACTTLVVAPTI